MQFSIVHPCFAPPHRRVVRGADGRTLFVEIGGYFDDIDGRVDTWWFSGVPREERGRTPPFRVPRFHQTMARWIGDVIAAGLTIAALVEPCASEEVARSHPSVEGTRVVPQCLIVRATKPDGRGRLDPTGENA